MILSVLLCGPFFYSYSTFQGPPFPPGWLEYGLKGNVRSFEQRLCAARQEGDHFICGDPVFNTPEGKNISLTFDKKGNKLTEKEMPGPGNVYDGPIDGADSNLIVEKINDIVYAYKYDGSGRRVETDFGNTGTFYSYNEKGLCTIESMRYASGKEFYRLDFTYDSKGRLTGHREFGEGADFPIRTRVLTYDKKNRVSTETWLNEKMMQITFDTITYDDKGRISEMIHRDDRQAVKYVRYVYAFDKRGNKTLDACYDASGAVLLKKVMEYDEKGAMVSCSCYNNKGENLAFKRYWTYSFDKKGNWTERVTYDGNKKALVITKREIEYY